MGCKSGGLASPCAACEDKGEPRISGPQVPASRVGLSQVLLGPKCEGSVTVVKQFLEKRKKPGAI